MPSTPEGKTFVQVTKRELPYNGVTHTAGSFLLVDEETARHACDEADPPHAERVSDEEAEEANLFRRFGLVDEPAPPPSEEGAESEPSNYRFSPAARGILVERGIDLSEYDGDATGPKQGRHVIAQDVQEWVEARTTRSADEEDEIPEIDITPKAREKAEEEGVDITQIEGTGKDGRITMPDIRDALEGEED